MAANAVELIQGNRAVAKQVEQDLPLGGEIEATGQQHDGGGVGSGDRGHNVPHEQFVAREPLHDGPEELQVPWGEAIQGRIIHFSGSPVAWLARGRLEPERSQPSITATDPSRIAAAQRRRGRGE